jgi:UDP-N-acetylglucosamine acyltransferase
VASIHPTAIVDPQSQVAANAAIGPFCIIEAGTVIGEGCRLASHVVIKAGTKLGKGNKVDEGAVLGGRPQHVHAGERVGKLKMGDGNIIRENATIHCGLQEGDCTVVGDDNLVMVNAHLGHDCRLGDHAIITNNAMIAGHVIIESRAYISGAVGIHQFCRVGQLAMVGGQAHIKQDILPFVMIDGLSSEVVGLNSVGLRRNGYAPDDILQLKKAYRVIYRSGLCFDAILKTLRQQFPTGPAAAFHEFLLGGTRGFVRERRRPPKSSIRLFSGQDREIPDDADAAVRNVG